MSDNTFKSGILGSRAVWAVERKLAMDDLDRPRDIMGDALSRRRSLASWSRLHLPALVAASIGLTLSLIAAYAVERWEQRVTKVEF